MPHRDTGCGEPDRELKRPEWERRAVIRCWSSTFFSVAEQPKLLHASRIKEKKVLMAEIKKVTKKTENPYVNLYELDTLNRKGNPGKYYVASRAKSIQTLELTTGSQHSDGVIIYSLYGENH